MYVDIYVRSMSKISEIDMEFSFEVFYILFYFNFNNHVFKNNNDKNKNNKSVIFVKNGSIND